MSAQINFSKKDLPRKGKRANISPDEFRRALLNLRNALINATKQIEIISDALDQHLTESGLNTTQD